MSFRSPLAAWLALTSSLGIGCLQQHGAPARPDAGTVEAAPHAARAHEAQRSDAGDDDSSASSDSATQSSQAGADAGPIAAPHVQPSKQPFDAGIDPERNAVAAGSICDRLATLQCAAEAACCDAPGRSQAECKTAMKASCDEDSMADAVAERAEAAFDAARAEQVFAELERLMRACDPEVVAYGASQVGLRSLFAGTVEAGGDCTPDSLLNTIMAGAALVACAERDTEACLPTVGRWTCTPRVEAGGDCFSDDNCQPGLYCDNPSLSVRGGSCKPLATNGKACELATECESLACDQGVCVTADVQGAYCLR